VFTQYAQADGIWKNPGHFKTREVVESQPLTWIDAQSLPVCRCGVHCCTYIVQLADFFTPKPGEHLDASSLAGYHAPANVVRTCLICCQSIGHYRKFVYFWWLEHGSMY